jgi:hypothetical protein
VSQAFSGGTSMTIPQHNNPTPPPDLINDLICDRPNSAHFGAQMAFMARNWGNRVYGRAIGGTPWPCLDVQVLYNGVPIFDFPPGKIIIGTIDAIYPTGHFNAIPGLGAPSPEAFDWTGLQVYANWDAEGIITDNLLIRAFDPNNHADTDAQKQAWIDQYNTSPNGAAGRILYDGPLVSGDTQYLLGVGPSDNAAGEHMSYEYWPNNKFPDGTDAGGTFMWSIGVHTVLQLNGLDYNIKFVNGAPA